MSAGGSVRLVTYASRPLRRAQQLNTLSAGAGGGFDRIFEHGPSDIDREFRVRNRPILRSPRGAGYWLWKPYFVHRHLEDLGPSEWLFYCDAGARFVHDVSPLIRHAVEHDADVLVFEHAFDYPEFMWTKRDAFILLGCDREPYWSSRHRIGGYLLWRRTEATLELARAWLRAACDPRLLTDAPNTCGLPDLPGFREHRHDQSILSLLTKERGIRAWRDPSQHGNSTTEHPECGYPQIIELTRDRTLTLRDVAGGLRRRVKRKLVRAAQLSSERGAD